MSGAAIYLWRMRASASEIENIARPKGRSHPQRLHGVTEEALRREHRVLLNKAHQQIAKIEAQLEQDSRKADGAMEVASGWPFRFKRTDFDLVEAFMKTGGSLRHDQLVRHVILNRRDIGLAPAQIGALDRMCRAYNEVLAPLLRSYRQIRIKEMIARIECGDVPATDPPRMSEEETRIVAAKIAAQNPARDPKTVCEEMLKNPPIAFGFGSYVQHKGKVYMHSDFNELPVSTRVHQEIQFFAFEFMAQVVLWFEKHGLMNHSETEKLMAEAVAYAGPLAKARRLSKKRAR